MKPTRRQHQDEDNSTVRLLCTWVLSHLCCFYQVLLVPTPNLKVYILSVLPITLINHLSHFP
jgi:hypothetical protein